MKRKNVRAVLFDWDGTLVDSCQPVFRAYVRMFAEYGITFDWQTYASTYSPAWHLTYRAVKLPEHCWTDADRKWLGYFEQETMSPLINGAIEALDHLARRDVARGIVTAGTRTRILRELAAFGIEHHFAHVVCGDDGPRRKPDPEALAFCLDRIGVAPEDAAYIGDSAEDMMMAKAAGVFSVGVRGTYPNHDTLMASSPDYVADSVIEAVDHLLT